MAGEQKLSLAPFQKVVGVVLRGEREEGEIGEEQSSVQTTC